VKHSGVLLFPILCILAIVSLILAPSRQSGRSHPIYRRSAFVFGSIVFIGATSIGILWSCYGFRYAARPGNAQITPPTAAFLQTLHSPVEVRVVGFAERHHLLPEAYLYGLTDILVLTNQGRDTYLFGKTYPQGQWFYFPSAMAIKSTIAFLLLLVLALATCYLWQRNRVLESLFLLLPAAVYLGLAMRSRLDLGLRHILPVYPFLIVLIAAAAWSLIRRSRGWAGAIAALLLFHAVSSLRAYPNYLEYSNEFFGGPSNTYKVLSDANVGWSSGLPALQRYIVTNHITQCWYAYNGPAVLSYFHLPCKPTPAYFSMLFGSPQPVVPETIQGPIFIASENLPATFWGPADLNPYDQFNHLKPDAVIGGETLVFNGTYNVRLLSAASHFAVASTLQRSHPDLALGEAQQAAVIAPEMLQPHEMLAALYAARSQPADAEREYKAALTLYQTKYAAYTNDVTPPIDPIPPGTASVASSK
jgi:hypothetical protein